MGSTSRFNTRSDRHQRKSFRFLPFLLAIALFLGIGLSAPLAKAQPSGNETTTTQPQPRGEASPANNGSGDGDTNSQPQGSPQTAQPTSSPATTPESGNPTEDPSSQSPSSPTTSPSESQPGPGSPSGDPAGGETPEEEPGGNQLQLQNFLTSNVKLIYGGAVLSPDAEGKYAIHPDTPYQLQLQFKEKPEQADGQIPTGEDLVYKLPAGMSALPDQAGKFKIETGEGPVEGNTYKIVDNQLIIKLAQNRALESSQQAEFFVTIDVSFPSDAAVVELTDTIKLNVRVTDDPDLTVTKTSRHDFSAGKVFYTIVIKSIGTNNNVEVSDQISSEGDVLKLDTNPKSISVKSSKKNASKPTAPEFGENGFKLTIPKITHQEQVSVTYSAFVDYSKIDIAVGGTAEQTTNKVSVTSDQIPAPKVTENNLKSGIKIGTMVKTAGTATQTVENSGIYEQPWKLKINEFGKLNLAGFIISDSVLAQYQSMMKYSGDGIEVIVNKGKTNDAGDSIEEIRNITWAQLGASDHEWSYQLPADDPEFATYEINYTTTVDVTNMIVPTQVKNNATSDDGDPQTPPEEVSATTSPLKPPHVFKLEKSVVAENSDEVEWLVNVDVVPQGYKSLIVSDTLPALTKGQTRYQDVLKAGTEPTVEGLIGTESYTFEQDAEHPERGFRLTFFQDQAKTQPGLGENLDQTGNPVVDENGTKISRQIKIKFTTTNDPAWLDAHRKGDSSLYRHINRVKATANDIDKVASATATPDKQGLSKSFRGITSQEIDGVDYPVFNYQLRLESVHKFDGETIEIFDEFDATMLKLAQTPKPNVSGAETLNVTNDTPGKVSFRINTADLPRYSDGTMHATYYLYYSLIPNSRDSLNQINQNPDGLTVKNTAKWGPVSSNTVEGKYVYSPLTKQITAEPRYANGYVASFSVTINPGGLKLGNGVDELTVTDEMTNMRLMPETLKFTPDSYPFKPVYQDGKLSVKIPDQQKVTISYQTQIIGTQLVNYSNTVTVAGSEAVASGQVAIQVSAGGIAPNPSVTLHKHDADSLFTSLEGATFGLYRIKEGLAEPVEGKLTEDQAEPAPLIFTTDETGQVTIKGDDGLLGWSLLVSDDQNEYVYQLKELSSPTGYKPLTEPITFTVVATAPADSTQLTDGSVLYIANEKEPKIPSDPNEPGSNPWRATC